VQHEKHYIWWRYVNKKTCLELSPGALIKGGKAVVYTALVKALPDTF
jgi:hypothetical protein